MAKITAAARADKGMRREANEDSVLAMVVERPEQAPMGLFAVCDGMGGHLGGEFASFWAVEAIKSEFAELLALSDPREYDHPPGTGPAKSQGGDITRFRD